MAKANRNTPPDENADQPDLTEPEKPAKEKAPRKVEVINTTGAICEGENFTRIPPGVSLQDEKTLEDPEFQRLHKTGGLRWQGDKQ